VNKSESPCPRSPPRDPTFRDAPIALSFLEDEAEEKREKTALDHCEELFVNEKGTSVPDELKQ